MCVKNVITTFSFWAHAILYPRITDTKTVRTGVVYINMLRPELKR